VRMAVPNPIFNLEWMRIIRGCTVSYVWMWYFLAQVVINVKISLKTGWSAVGCGRFLKLSAKLVSSYGMANVVGMARMCSLMLTQTSARKRSGTPTCSQFMIVFARAHTDFRSQAKRDSDKCSRALRVRVNGLVAYLQHANDLLTLYLTLRLN